MQRSTDPSYTPGMVTIEIHLRDLSNALVEAWNREFAGVASVRTSCGDIFRSSPAVVSPDDLTHIKADAIVSPANSFGFMDGGIDAVYTRHFGTGLQKRLQTAIRDQHAGELPIGQAVIVPTDHTDIPWCISAPTMRIPRDVSGTVNAYLAFRAALRAALQHNRDDRSRISTILCPGLATAAGKMPAGRCARQMRAAWERILGPHNPFPQSLGAAVDDEYGMLA